jgi:hypothetical protein
MFVPFDQISPTARIWIYQADRKLSAGQVDFINRFLKDYCNRWKAHGAELKASFDIRFDHFIVMAADEDYNSTSGCSIDDSVRAIKEIENNTNSNFFNRNLVAFKQDTGVILIDRSNLKEKYLTGMWNDASLTFNNLVDTKSKLDLEWITEAGKTWLKRFIPAGNIHS